MKLIGEELSDCQDEVAAALKYLLETVRKPMIEGSLTVMLLPSTYNT